MLPSLIMKFATIKHTYWNVRFCIENNSCLGGGGGGGKKNSFKPHFRNYCANAKNTVSSEHNYNSMKTYVAPMVLSLKKSGGNWYLTKRAASGGTSSGI